MRVAPNDGSDTATAGTAADPDAGSGHGRLVLAAMICAVAMTFIDQTIVAIAAPQLQNELSLSTEQVQWVINGYLLSLAALFAFGGRLSDIAGHRKIVVLGVIVFAGSSTMCGFTPTGSLAAPWIIGFRVLQGAGAALMYPAALAIVVRAFPLERRGQAMAIFFGVAGGLTALGPLAGGYLTQWTWRSIFWINVPVAIAALVLTAIAKPDDDRTPAPLDLRGLVLIVAGMALAVLGLQQSGSWGWSSPATIGCIAVGVALLAVFVLVETRTADPLIRMEIFRTRAFAVQNAVLFVAMAVFIPVFFFASTYAQVSLGYSSSDAGLYLLTFFAGFAPGVQIGGKLLDTRGAKPPVVVGCAIAAVGFALWGSSLTTLSQGSQWYWIVLAGVGMGLMVGPSNTDAVNRAPRTSYGEATGITQTVRNFGSSIGLAVLGTVLISSMSTNVVANLEAAGVPSPVATEIAGDFSLGGGPPPGQATDTPEAQTIESAIEQSFAESSQTLWYLMAGTMAVAFVIALVGLQSGRQEHVVDALPGGG